METAKNEDGVRLDGRLHSRDDQGYGVFLLSAVWCCHRSEPSGTTEKVLLSRMPLQVEQYPPKTAELEDRELFFHILAIIAEEESKSIGRNLKLGLLGLHDEGIPTGRVTYGYRRVNKAGEWRIEESEARRVRYAFDQAAKGVCYKDIRAGLDRMEKAENTGVSWTQNRNRLTKLLKHIAYQGDYITDCYYTTYGKNGKRYSKLNKGERPQVHLEDHHEPIVSREQFERVQTLMQMGLLDSGRCRFTDKERKILDDPKWQ